MKREEIGIRTDDYTLKKVGNEDPQFALSEDSPISYNDPYFQMIKPSLEGIASSERELRIIIKDWKEKELEKLKVIEKKLEIQRRENILIFFLFLIVFLSIIVSPLKQFILNGIKNNSNKSQTEE